MKTMRLWIIALMLLVSLCGCSSNQETPTSEVSATSSNVSGNDSDISLSDGETTSALTTSEATSSKPTSLPEEKSPSQSTTSQKATETPTTANSSSGNSSNQSENKQTTSSKEQEKPASSKTEEKPKSAFSKPYDTGTMKSELISYGISIGMTHITKFSEDFGGGEITPTGTTWLPPVETWHYGSNSADKLKQDICYDIKNWKSKGESTYTLWFEKDSSHAGEYIIYVIIG